MIHRPRERTIAALDEHPGALLEEERIARGAFDQAGGRDGWQATADGATQNLARLGRAKPAQPDERQAAMSVFGLGSSERQEEHRLGPGRGVDLAEEGHQIGMRPVEVVEHDHERLPVGDGTKDRSYRRRSVDARAAGRASNGPSCPPRPRMRSHEGSQLRFQLGG
jgi:hypothetical protein